MRPPVVFEYLPVILIIGTILYFVLAVRRTRRQALARRKNLCPKCGYDLRASDNRCPECGQKIEPLGAVLDAPLDLEMLRTDWPADAIEIRTPEVGEEYVPVHTTPRAMEADLLCEQLQMRGIAARTSAKVDSLPAMQMYGLQPTASTRVFVPAGDLELARAYLGRLRERAARRNYEDEPEQEMTVEEPEIS